MPSWTLTSYADVCAAIREPRLSGDTVHVAVREAAIRELAPERLAAWQDQMDTLARELAGALPEDQPVDLVSRFARPWSLKLAGAATRALPSDTGRLAALARQVFLAAVNGDSTSQHDAASELARSFQSESATASARVQTFVALSQTLPCLLAGAWLALMQHPEETLWLRQNPTLMTQAIEELLRYAGPSRAVYREASAAVRIGDAEIQAGDQVILMLWAANRDPAQFPDPDRLDFRRGAAGHVAFGGGAHACSGAPLVRMAVAAATTALLWNFRSIEPAGEPEWIDGFAIRGPASLPAILRR